MLTFVEVMLGMLAASAISTTIGFALIYSKRFQKWMFKKYNCFENEEL